MSKQEQAPKHWWVSRDGGAGKFYNLHHMVEKPAGLHGIYPLESSLVAFDTLVFHKTFALRLKKGECLEIEPLVIVLKK